MDGCNVNDLVSEIARHLHGYSPETLWGTPYLMGPDGARLAVHQLMDRTEWIVVTGLYPVESSDLRRHSITVATTRGPEHIAKKITRRLLPKYVRDLKQQARDAKRTKRADLVDTLLSLLPGHVVTAADQEAVIRWRLGSTFGVFDEVCQRKCTRSGRKYPSAAGVVKGDPGVVLAGSQPGPRVRRPV
ncbi:hypothetical protein ABGB18_46095, partial [Nonomuraea sp. B12E4]|uniref:hypothetical protein n=1 Tax=Nonomuraea sp. B12E4 TaxID=3153564 RepID=UPI00325ED310